MKVLVTGGAGFIGSVTVRALRRADHDVLVIDDLSNGDRRALDAAVDLVVADLRDAEAVDTAVQGFAPEACIHFAGLIEAGESQRHPERFFDVNTGGSAVLLRALRRHDVDSFLFSSTAAVYGEPGYTPIDEGHPLAPTNAYGESKLLVERMLRWHHDLRGMRVSILRYFNAAGASEGLPERHEPESHLIPLALQVAAGRRRELTIFGRDYPTEDGTAVRDFVHVEDLADAHVMALAATRRAPWSIYNLGTGRGFSVADVVRSVERVTGREIATVDDARRPGDPAVLVASADEARRELGWEPHRSDLDRMVHDAWQEFAR